MDPSKENRRKIKTKEERAGERMQQQLRKKKGNSTVETETKPMICLESRQISVQGYFFLPAQG